MLNRSNYEKKIDLGLSRSKIVAIFGPRQCGKTTLAQHFAKKVKSVFFDLESPKDLLKLSNPELALESINDLIIIDEIQLKPELFSILRVLADKSKNGKFLILGSASPQMIKNASESLAGRVEFVDVQGFDISETNINKKDILWERGGFPLSFLARDTENSLAWREGFIRTFLQRDIPQLGYNIGETPIRRFWTMLAHNQGQVLNSSSLGSSMGVSYKTIRSYLDILTHTFMVRQLQPWYENVKKRQVKSPKVYISDSGLVHKLLSINTLDELYSHPVLGASWEGFVLEQIFRLNQNCQFYFWATHSGAELDLLMFKSAKRIGIEIKYSESPQVTKSMKIALSDLKLDHLYIVYPGKDFIPLDKFFSICPLQRLQAELENLICVS